MPQPTEHEEPEHDGPDEVHEGGDCEGGPAIRQSWEFLAGSRQSRGSELRKSLGCLKVPGLFLAIRGRGECGLDLPRLHGDWGRRQAGRGWVGIAERRVGVLQAPISSSGLAIWLTGLQSRSTPFRGLLSRGGLVLISARSAS